MWLFLLSNKFISPLTKTSKNQQQTQNQNFTLAQLLAVLFSDLTLFKFDYWPSPHPVAIWFLHSLIYCFKNTF